MGKTLKKNARRKNNRINHKKQGYKPLNKTTHKKYKKTKKTNKRYKTTPKKYRTTNKRYKKTLHARRHRKRTNMRKTRRMNKRTINKKIYYQDGGLTMEDAKAKARRGWMGIKDAGKWGWRYVIPLPFNIIDLFVRAIPGSRKFFEVAGELSLRLANAIRKIPSERLIGYRDSIQRWCDKERNTLRYLGGVIPCGIFRAGRATTKFAFSNIYQIGAFPFEVIIALFDSRERWGKEKTTIDELLKLSTKLSASVAESIPVLVSDLTKPIIKASSSPVKHLGVIAVISAIATVFAMIFPGSTIPILMLFTTLLEGTGLLMGIDWFEKFKIEGMNNAPQFMKLYLARGCKRFIEHAPTSEKGHIRATLEANPKLIDSLLDNLNSERATSDNPKEEKEEIIEGITNAVYSAGFTRGVYDYIEKIDWLDGLDSAIKSAAEKTEEGSVQFDELLLTTLDGASPMVLSSLARFIAGSYHSYKLRAKLETVKVFLKNPDIASYKKEMKLGGVTLWTSTDSDRFSPELLYNSNVLGICDNSPNLRIGCCNDYRENNIKRSVEVRRGETPQLGSKIKIIPNKGYIDIDGFLFTSGSKFTVTEGAAAAPAAAEGAAASPGAAEGVEAEGAAAAETKNTYIFQEAVDPADVRSGVVVRGEDSKTGKIKTFSVDQLMEGSAVFYHKLPLEFNADYVLGNLVEEKNELIEELFPASDINQIETEDSVATRIGDSEDLYVAGTTVGRKKDDSPEDLSSDSSSQSQQQPAARRRSISRALTLTSSNGDAPWQDKGLIGGAYGPSSSQHTPPPGPPLPRLSQPLTRESRTRMEDRSLNSVIEAIDLINDTINDLTAKKYNRTYYTYCSNPTHSKRLKRILSAFKTPDPKYKVLSRLNELTIDDLKDAKNAILTFVGLHRHDKGDTDSLKDTDELYHYKLRKILASKIFCLCRLILNGINPDNNPGLKTVINYGSTLQGDNKNDFRLCCLNEYGIMCRCYEEVGIHTRVQASTAPSPTPTSHPPPSPPSTTSQQQMTLSPLSDQLEPEPEPVSGHAMPQSPLPSPTSVSPPPAPAPVSPPPAPGDLKNTLEAFEIQQTDYGIYTVLNQYDMSKWLDDINHLYSNGQMMDESTKQLRSVQRESLPNSKLYIVRKCEIESAGTVDIMAAHMKDLTVNTLFERQTDNTHVNHYIDKIEGSQNDKNELLPTYFMNGVWVNDNTPIATRGIVKLESEDPNRGMEATREALHKITARTRVEKKIKRSGTNRGRGRGGGMTGGGWNPFKRDKVNPEGQKRPDSAGTERSDATDETVDSIPTETEQQQDENEIDKAAEEALKAGDYFKISTDKEKPENSRYFRAGSSVEYQRTKLSRDRLESLIEHISSLFFTRPQDDYDANDLEAFDSLLEAGAYDETKYYYGEFTPRGDSVDDISDNNIKRLIASKEFASDEMLCASLGLLPGETVREALEIYSKDPYSSCYTSDPKLHALRVEQCMGYYKDSKSDDEEKEEFIKSAGIPKLTDPHFEILQTKKRLAEAHISLGIKEGWKVLSFSNRLQNGIKYLVMSRMINIMTGSTGTLLGNLLESLTPTVTVEKFYTSTVGNGMNQGEMGKFPYQYISLPMRFLDSILLMLMLDKETSQKIVYNSLGHLVLIVLKAKGMIEGIKGGWKDPRESDGSVGISSDPEGETADLVSPSDTESESDGSVGISSYPEGETADLVSHSDTESEPDYPFSARGEVYMVPPLPEPEPSVDLGIQIEEIQPGNTLVIMKPKYSLSSLGARDDYTLEDLCRENDITESEINYHLLREQGGTRREIMIQLLNEVVPPEYEFYRIDTSPDDHGNFDTIDRLSHRPMDNINININFLNEMIREGELHAYVTTDSSI